MTITQKVLRFKLVKTEGSGVEYWMPYRNGGFDRGAAQIADRLGHPPDTGGWIEPPAESGWYSHESVAALIYDLTKQGYAVEFLA